MVKTALVYGPNGEPLICRVLGLTCESPHRSGQDSLAWKDDLVELVGVDGSKQAPMRRGDVYEFHADLHKKLRAAFDSGDPDLFRLWRLAAHILLFDDERSDPRKF